MATRKVRMKTPVFRTGGPGPKPAKRSSRKSTKKATSSIKGPTPAFRLTDTKGRTFNFGAVYRKPKK